MTTLIQFTSLLDDAHLQIIEVFGPLTRVTVDAGVDYGPVFIGIHTNVSAEEAWAKLQELMVWWRENRGRSGEIRIVPHLCPEGEEA